MSFHDRDGDGEPDASYVYVPQVSIPVSNHETDHLVMPEAIRMSRELDPDFLFVNLGDVDRVGHADPTGNLPLACGAPRRDRHRRAHPHARGGPEGPWDLGADGAHRRARPQHGLVHPAELHQPARRLGGRRGPRGHGAVGGQRRCRGVPAAAPQRAAGRRAPCTDARDRAGHRRGPRGPVHPTQPRRRRRRPPRRGGPPRVGAGRGPHRRPHRHRGARPADHRARPALQPDPRQPRPPDHPADPHRDRRRLGGHRGRRDHRRRARP
jgi:hypothetical protein